MSVHFRRIAVLGLGLLGGSVARAARERGLADRVVGAARRPGPLEAALRDGVVDETASAQDAVRGADLVVLATPVGAMEPLLRAAAPNLEDGALVTDVGSVKGPLADTVPGLLPPGVAYVGAHPMAGSHLRGVEHARGDLFEGAPCVLTPAAGVETDALERCAGFWRALGARVVLRSPEEHDTQVAWTSHVPHLLAFAFAGALADAPAGAVDVAGSGFRDFTRIAHSDPALWTEILCANRKAVAGPLQQVSERLGELARVLETGDPDAVLRALSDARDALGRYAAGNPDARSGGENLEITPPRAGTHRSESNNS
jgi:prephenate dehydrogenase